MLLEGYVAGRLCCWKAMLLEGYVAGRLCCWKAMLLEGYVAGRLCCWKAIDGGYSPATRISQGGCSFL